jgi:heme exporter protein C
MRSFSAHANPARFAGRARSATPWLFAGALLFVLPGLYLALVWSPPDYQQGEGVRIMYVHVPAAWLALVCYCFMATASAVSLILRHPLADIAGKAAAPIGAVFTGLALLTGALWGKPMWGTYWVWDARLTSVLVLFFLYLGYMALWRAIDAPLRAGRAAAVLALVGFINVPIIKFSVDWWTTLHQPASVLRLEGPTIDAAMLTPLLVMATAYMFLFAALVLVRMRAELAARRYDTLMLGRM